MVEKKEWNKRQGPGGSKRRFIGKGDDGKFGKFAKCGKCGRSQHDKGDDCPAVGQQCHNCGRPNHFRSVCTSKPKVNAIKSDIDGEGEVAKDDLKLFAIQAQRGAHLICCLVGVSFKWRCL